MTVAEAEALIEAASRAEKQRGKLRRRVKAAARAPPELGYDPDRLISPRQLAEMTGYSLLHIRRLYRTGRLPRPLPIFDGSNRLAWKAAVILPRLANPANAQFQPPVNLPHVRRSQT